MTRATLRGWVILLFLMGFMPPAHAQTDPISLIIGFYGDSSHGMELAIAEINKEGGFKGADGKTYRFEGRVSKNPAELVDAVAVLAQPDVDYSGEPVAWQMPVFLLSPEAGLGLHNIQATVFRGMTDQMIQNDVLADVLVNSLDVTQITVIGSDTFLDSLARVVPAPPMIQHFRKETLTQEQFNQVPLAIFYDGMDAAAFLDQIKAADWRGILALKHAENLTPPEGVRLISCTSWLPALDDALSRKFTIAYRVAYDEEPTALDVAAYDLTWAVRLLVTRTGIDARRLVAALPQTAVMLTTQGQIQPYGGRELIRTVTVYEVLPDGDFQVLSRRDNGILQK